MFYGLVDCSLFSCQMKVSKVLWLWMGFEES